MKKVVHVLALGMLLATLLFTERTLTSQGYSISSIKTPEAALDFFVDLLTDPNFQVNHSFKHLCANLAPLLQEHPDPRVQNLGGVLQKIKGQTNVVIIGVFLRPFQDVFDKYGRGRTPLPENILRSRFNEVLCYKGA